MIAAEKANPVESQLPGRIRMRVPRENRQEEILHGVISAIEEIAGVLSVVANIVTGSLLIEYDPEIVAAATLIDSGLRSGAFESAPLLVSFAEAPRVPTSDAAASMVTALRHFDSMVHRMSHGAVDGRTAVSLLLIGTSLGRAFVSQKRVRTPWYTLLWYGYSIFSQSQRSGGNGASSPSC